MSNDKQRVINEELRKSINEGLNVNPLMPRNVLPKSPPATPPAAPKRNKD
jgi:hypothetical protein